MTGERRGAARRAPQVARALARRARRLARRRRPSDPAGVRYRDGIPNRADELVWADEAARPFVEAGVLTMGAYSYFAPTIRRYSDGDGRVTIGRYSSIARSAQLYVGGSHRDDWVTTYGLRVVFDLPGAYTDGTPASRGDITIGSDVWVANDAVVLSGVTIGDGAVVATRSVVTRDVRPYAVVAGNPAREVRRRFDDHQVEALLRIRWWDWPVERVLEHVDQLCSDDLDGFIARFDPGPRPGA